MAEIITFPVKEEKEKELLSVKGVPFSRVYEELVAKSFNMQLSCVDYNAMGSQMRFDPYDGVIKYQDIDSEEVFTQGMSRYAFSQLCGKLGVPVRYIDKCIDSGNIELAGENVNEWLTTFDSNLFLRTYENRVRGVLSDKYSVLDTPHILDALGEVLDPNDFVSQGHFLSEERFHLRLAQKHMMNIRGEDLYAGIQIDSSDVGRNVLSVKLFIFKQVCSNGLCISQGGGVLFEQKHIGISAEDFRYGLEKSFQRLPDIAAHAKDLIENSRGKDKYALDIMLDEERFLEQVQRDTKLSKEASGKVIQLMTSKYGKSKWGMINSITEVAQDFSLDRRIELETLAGDMLFSA